MRINHNLSAMNANRQLGVNQSAMAKSLEKLSSGLKINRAADDASGLSISEKMRAQIRGLDQASTNAQDGVSLIQTADGNLSETHDILQRVRELAVKGATGTLATEDSEAVQDEVNALLEEVDRIGNTTEFNTKKLLNGELKSADGVAAGKNQTVGSEVGKQVAGKMDGTFTTGGVTDGSFTKETILIDDAKIEVDWNAVLSADEKAALKGANTDTTTRNKASDIITQKINDAIDKSGKNIAHITGNVTNDGKLILESGTKGTGSKVVLESTAGVLNDIGNLTSTDGTSKYNGVAIMGDKTDAELTAELGNLGSVASNAIVKGATMANAEATSAAKNSAADALIASATAGLGSMGEWASFPSMGGGSAAGAIASNALINAGLGSMAEGIAGQVLSSVDAVAGGMTGESVANLTKSLINAAKASAALTASDAFSTEIGSAGGKASNAAIVAGVASVSGLDVGKFDLKINGQNLAEVTLSENIDSKTSMKSAADIIANDINAAIDKHNAALGVNEVGQKGFLSHVTIDSSGGRFTINSDDGAVEMTDKIGKEVVKNLGLSSAQTSASANGGMTLQIGANKGQTMTFGIDDMRTAALGINALKLDTQTASSDSLEKVDKAIAKVSKQRSALGAAQNRLDHTIKNLDTSAENLQAAESRIRDTDMSKTMMEYTKLNILSQASQSMLAQANQAPQGVLQLLQ